MKINFSANTQGQDGFFSCERLLTALRVHSAGSPKTSSFICCTCGHCVVRAVNTSHPFLFPTHYTLILLLNGARQRSSTDHVILTPYCTQRPYTSKELQPCTSTVLYPIQYVHMQVHFWILIGAWPNFRSLSSTGPEFP